MIVPGPDNPFFKIMRGILYLWVVALVLALYPYTEDPATPIKFLITTLAALLVSTVWVAGLATRQVAVRPVGIPVVLLFLFLAVQCLAALTSDAPYRSLHAVLPWATYGILAGFGHQLFSQVRHVRTLFRVVVAAVVLSSVYGLAQYGGYDPFPWAMHEVEEYRGLPATYGHPNFAGHALVIAIVLCVGLIMDTWRRGGRLVEKGAYGAALALLLTHLYLTHMRGGVAALGLAGLAVATAVMFHRRKGDGLGAWIRGLAFAGLVLVAGGVAVMFFGDRLALDTSLQLRLHSIAGATALFLDHWPLGIGPGNYAFQNILQWTDFESLWYALENKRNHHVHNEWLEIAVESGLPGLFLFLLLFLHGLVAPFRNGAGPSIIRYTLAVALLAVAVDACFGFNWHVPVSGGLVFVLLVLRGDGNEKWTVPDPPLRWGAVLLVPLVMLYTLQGWWQFQGERYYQQGQGALAWANAASPKSPQNSLSFTDAARSLFRVSQRYQPWDFRPSMALGDLAFNAGRPSDAVALYEEALARHPHLPRLQLQLARALVDVSGQSEGPAGVALLARADGLATGVVARCPELGDGYALLGTIQWLRAKGQDESLDGTVVSRAIESLEAARRNGVAANPALEYTLARAREGAGDMDRAAEAMTRAINLAPNTPGYWDGLASIAGGGDDSIRRHYGQLLMFHLSGDNDLGASLRSTLASRLSLLPASPVALGVTEKCLGRVADAFPGQAALWSAWLRSLPEGKRRDALVARVSAREAGGVLAPAVAAVVKLLAAPQDPSPSLTALADSMANDPGQLNPEINGLDVGPLLQLLDFSSPPGGEASLQRGRIFFYTGDFAAAQSQLQAAATQLPAARLGEVDYYLSRTLAHRGQPDAALALAREALQRDRGSVPFQWNLALRLAESGEKDAARFQLEALLPQVARAPETHQAILDALESLRTRGDRP